MLRCPCCRSVLIARLRELAVFSGPRPVQIFEAPSPKVVSRTTFSMVHCDLTS